MVKCDLVVIGAGVVGCAIARHLKTKHPSLEIVVLEKNSVVASETSQLNSGVVHSGVHEDPRFLKSRLAMEGSRLAIAFAQANNVPLVKTGMLAVAGHKSLLGGLLREWKSFARMVSNAKEKGISYEFVFSKKKIRALAPDLHALAAVHIPDVWVLDSKVFVESLAADAITSGAHFVFNAPVQLIVPKITEWGVITSKDTYFAKMVINAAGLYADDMAHLAGFRGYKIYPWRGEYCEIIGEKAKRVKHLIYMVTPPKNSGKGIHFGPRPDGRLFIGPNARPVPSKNYYTEDKTPVEDFLEVGQRFYPDLQLEDLRWAYSGIRPKLTPDATSSDFSIKLDSDSPPFVNIIGIESPGLTASMAIAEYVEGLLKSQLNSA